MKNSIIIENNRKAMDALTDNDFEMAQKFFRQGCRLGDSYQAFNNLGMHYIDNGIICKNGKTISGNSIGKRLLEKSLLIRETSRVLDNLGIIEYNAGNLIKSLDYWERSHRLTNNNATLYNISVVLFRLGEYKKAVDLSKELIDNMFLAKKLFIFARCMYDDHFLELILRDDAILGSFDEIDKLYLYYHTGKYEEVINMQSKLIDERIGLNENDLAILFDSYIKCGKELDGKLILKENHIDIYDTPYKNKLWKEILRLSRDHEYREKIVSSCKFIPQIINENCPYFGCKIHNTQWI